MPIREAIEGVMEKIQTLRIRSDYGTMRTLVDCLEMLQGCVNALDSENNGPDGTGGKEVKTE